MKKKRMKFPVALMLLLVSFALCGCANTHVCYSTSNPGSLLLEGPVEVDPSSVRVIRGCEGVLHFLNGSVALTGFPAILHEEVSCVFRSKLEFYKFLAEIKYLNRKTKDYYYREDPDVEFSCMTIDSENKETLSEVHFDRRIMAVVKLEDVPLGYETIERFTLSASVLPKSVCLYKSISELYDAIIRNDIPFYFDIDASPELATLLEFYGFSANK